MRSFITKWWISSLRFALGNQAGFKVALDENIEESSHAAKRHSSTVLTFHRCQIGEISPLHRFTGIGGLGGNVKTIAGSHFFHFYPVLCVGRSFLRGGGWFFEIFAVFQISLQ